MHLEKIKLSNFKCFDEIEFSTSNITLLTGANSSGKSSMIYGILGSIQSREFPFQFSPNGKYIRMGDYTEIVHNHISENDIEIEFSFKNDENRIETINTIWQNDKYRNLPTLKQLHASSEYYNLKITKVRKYNLEFKYFPDKDTNYESYNPDILNKVIQSLEKVLIDGNKSIDSKNEEKKESIINKFMNLNVNTSINFKFNDLSELDKGRIINKNFFLDRVLSSIKKNFTNFEDSTNFISSFRLFPDRTYYETSKQNLKVGKFGENYEDQIISWESKKDPKYNELLKIMNDIGLFSEIKTKRLDGGRFEILIRNKKDGVWSTLSDVGFGISQFLPIIVADLQLEKNSTLFIAQPEIHLHPKIQAQFADYIISRIKNHQKKYVIETHSEYLINRLRLEITKDNINQNQISTYYVENNGINARLYDLKFLANGQIKGAPKGFFDTYMLDVMNIAINAH